MRTVIIGFGDIGHRVAKLELAQGRYVTALIRDKEKIEAAREFGIEPFLADLDQPDTLAQQPLESARVYYFAPPPSTNVHDSRVTNWLRSIDRAKPALIVYISTTGVYGHCHGEWVDEQRPPNPAANRAKRRLSAELQLSEWGAQQAVPVIRLRVPGIYHPERLPMTSLLQGRPILRSADAPYSNRIHADDLAQICVAAARHDRGGKIYNVADSDSCTMSEYFLKVAEAFNLPRPKEISWEEARQQLSPGMLSYLQESRRIENKKMLRELGVVLQYPALEDGLRGILAAKQPQPNP
ncbi:MAG: SDR family oxidoreductase [Candidatus Polarisedimenticolaceae bacterium]|nr:SDR family oxidoreductase [Candidatus Polarisedimenticolaceae bacterium]